ncbi:MAG: diguanylate cyclase [Bdellovibrio sp.]|nr:MAG: diguanylate cyclase [Bdellovibrio sp.]
MIKEIEYLLEIFLKRGFFMSAPPPSTRTVVVVDDDLSALKIMEKTLQHEGYKVKTASSGEEALKQIHTARPHLVLLDINMPGINGLEILKHLRDQQDYVSTIFISGDSDKEAIVRGLDAGADDYICKPFDPLELLARVRCQLRIKDIRDDLKQANAKLQELVVKDDLTGLYNMRSLYQKLDYEINRAARYNRCVCAIMMDMDNFKTVNDSHDHLFGSFVLKKVGQIIQKNVRKVDFAARYGGDEFLIVLTEIDLDGALKFTERLRQTIENTLFKNDLHEMKLTASIGFALTAPGTEDIDARTLVRYADNMLYKAKESGRNCVKYYVFKKKTDSNPEKRRKNA